MSRPGVSSGDVLIACRDGAMRELLTVLLQRVAGRVVFAEDADVLLGALRVLSFGMVVVVVERFGWPGLDAADALLVESRLRGTKVLLVAQESPGAEWDFVDGHLRLPFRTAELEGRARALMGRSA